MRVLTAILLLLCSISARASHLYGGYMRYSCDGNFRYSIELVLQKECNSVVDFDKNAAIGVYDSSGTVLIHRFYLTSPTIDTLSGNTFDPCLGFPSSVCLEQGVYKQSISLAPRPGGYTFVHQRCCRPAGITNIKNSNTQGNTFMVHIPDPGSFCNNAPSPKNQRPLALCLGKPFSIDRSFIDPDGDSLTYTLSKPIIGGGADLTQVNGPNGPVPDPPSPPPYANIQWENGYGNNQMLGTSNALAINPSTGEISGTATTVGSFVIAITVNEYRNGTLIGTYIEDLQLKTVNCLENVKASFLPQKDACEGLLLTFENNSTTAPNYLWNFGDTIAGDTSTAFSPKYRFSDTGKYEVTLIANPGLHCSDTMTRTVSAYPHLDITFNGQLERCISNPEFTFELTGRFASYAEINWDFTDWGAPNGSQSIKPSTYFPTQGYYPIVLKVSQGPCIDSIVKNAVVFPRPNSDFKLIDTTLCLPQTIEPIPVTQEWPGLIYHWFINGQETKEHYPVWEVDTPGLHLIELYVEQTKGCIGNSRTQERRIVVEPIPFADFETNGNSFFQSEATVEIQDQKKNAGFCTYFINDSLLNPEGCSFSHTFEQPGTYEIMQVADNFGLCPDTTTRIIEVTKDFDYFIPTAFTPNGDLTNDVYEVQAFGITNYAIQVYDRWGTLVFEGNSLTDTWNGTNLKGQDCPADVYVYSINLTTRLGKEITETGHIMLTR